MTDFDPMPNDPISLRNAAIAFGPCCHGTDHALAQLMGKLAEGDGLYRYIQEGSEQWRSSFWMEYEPAPSADWFRHFASLSDQNPLGLDDAVDDFREQIEEILYRRDDLVLPYDEVKAIWIKDDYSSAEPNAKLLPTWTFTQGLAWVATRDLGVVGSVSHSPDHHPVGWLACLVAERCRTCTHQRASDPKWHHCHCLSDALKELTAHAQALKLATAPELRISTEHGTVSLTAEPSGKKIRFDPKNLMQAFPPKGTVAEKPKRTGGAPNIVDLVKESYLKRLEGGEAKSDSAVSKILAKEVEQEHGGQGKKLPKADTIRQKLPVWRKEAGYDW